MALTVASLIGRCSRRVRRVGLVGQGPRTARGPDDPNEPGHDECLIISSDGQTRILFIEGPEPKPVKNRLYFDLRPSGTDREQDIARVLALGATQLADRGGPTARAR